ncbi:proline-rich receptor-like protein kinase PERK14 [Brassica napus]|uniref:proline-rich receptor-like protein kinase PERK14 n=1 Tax=Brassica napus TaxID=3708 RepID=UPI00207A5ADF|nr:proline-rich receptor-like protein kinase PERK14 [Brassica napus]
MDDFTKNLVSLTLSHVKVAVNLTKPLPSVVEFVRQSGEVVEVQVSYPWVPPTCSVCKELGHVSRNCLQAPLPPKSSDVPAKKPQQAASASQKGKNVATATPTTKKPDPLQPTLEKIIPSPSSTVYSQASTSTTPLNPDPPPPPIQSQPPKAPPLITATPLASSHPLAVIPSPSKSPPDTFITPSLKRPRSDPDQKPFPSFMAQLSYYSTKPLAIHSSSFVKPFSNTFSVLDPDGSLHPEETID